MIWRKNIAGFSILYKIDPDVFFLQQVDQTLEKRLVL